ncbi:MAG: hypothetical protein IPO08_22555 [Xanthomonadales bacterium]|nr:hypothetical protein [Xanthomonadales bacterium]
MGFHLWIGKRKMTVEPLSAVHAQELYAAWCRVAPQIEVEIRAEDAPASEPMVTISTRELWKLTTSLVEANTARAALQRQIDNWRDPAIVTAQANRIRDLVSETVRLKRRVQRDRLLMQFLKSDLDQRQQEAATCLAEEGERARQLEQQQAEMVNELEAIKHAAHMPEGYEHGLASWINQHLYAAYVGASFSPEVMQLIESGALFFPDSPDGRAARNIRPALDAFYSRVFVVVGAFSGLSVDPSLESVRDAAVAELNLAVRQLSIDLNTGSNKATE